MKKYTLLTALGLALALSPSLAHAWGGDGHRIVCPIAWDEPRAVTRKQVQSLLDIQTREQFANLCNWAHLETAPWHFVNVPQGATSVNVDRDCKKPRSCAVVQIDRQTAVLKSQASKEERAMALKFIGHFVGDIHKPLHAGYAEDRGGNRIRGAFMGKKMDMHELWDAALIASEHRPWPEIARGLRAAR
jgi:nuclease S1